MPPWTVRYDWKAGAYLHTTTGRFGHSLLTPLVSNVFGVLGMAVTLWHDGEWLPIHSVSPNIIRFEVEHGLSPERGEYNGRHLARAREQRTAVHGEHAGYLDLFVPIVARQHVIGILVTGPFATHAATSADILERWRWLTGCVGHPSDPEFAWYLRETLGVLVLNPRQVLSLQRLLTRFAQLMAGEGRADELANECNLLRVELEQARFVERAWQAARTMLDERSPRSVFSETNAQELRKLASAPVIDHILVGLMVNRSKSAGLVDEAIRRHAFQRRTALLARKMGGVLAGQVGEHGVVFLCGSGGSAAQKKRRLHDLSQSASALAHEDFDLALHFGAAAAGESKLLSPSYHAALAASEAALTEGKAMVMAAHEIAHAPNSLRGLRGELARVEEHPAMLAARFERYLEAVSLHCGQRLETALAHLEVGFEDMGASLLEAGVLEAKSLTTMRSALWRAAADARNMNELFAAYRRAFADVADAAQRPVPARRDRSLHRAVEYIRHHFTASLRISAVARVAGFNRSHFSRLFIEREGMPFEDYVRGLRLERSQQLLTDTDLHVARVAELSGFASSQYFCRVFQRAVKMTPTEFRRAPRRARRSRNESAMTNSPGYKRSSGDPR